MPVSRKRRKEGKSRPRDRVEAASAPRADPPASSGGGMLTRMRGGFQKMAGTAPKKNESLLSKIVTWAIVAIAAYFVARRFGIVP